MFEAGGSFALSDGEAHQDAGEDYVLLLPPSQAHPFYRNLNRLITCTANVFVAKNHIPDTFCSVDNLDN